jgi:hypothetical protein
VKIRARLERNPVARSYEDVAAPLRPAGDPALDRFAQAVQTHFEDAYDQTFALAESRRPTAAQDESQPRPIR